VDTKRRWRAALRAEWSFQTRSDEVPTLKPIICSLLAALTFAQLAPNADGATVAYWRFEAGPANAPVPHAGAAGVFDGSTLDVSGNGNSLSAWTQGDWAGFAYRADVPFSTIPLDGSTNRFSVKNTGAYPALFTSAAGSSPTGINAQTMTPVQFTIEASYKPEANGGYRTIVGRDARNLATANGDLAALYIQVRPDDSVGIAFTDVSGYSHSAYSPPGWLYGFNFGANPEGTNAPWYHLAAVSDGSTLKMYVNNVLVASTDMMASGSPNRALAKGSVNGSDWTAGAWSVGRGLYAGGHTDRAYGLIDEVRISDTALATDTFLAAPRTRITRSTVVGTTMTLNAAGGQSGATCYLLQSASLNAPVANWTPIAVKVLDANGNASFTTTVNPAGTPVFFGLRAALLVPPQGALSYSLAGGSENWPADVRARIVYAMDGAVAQYNRYGTFRKQVTANYNSGVPTAQGNYSGWIDFGGNAAYQNYRTALHEISHTLGVGTTWQWGANLSGGVWAGANGVAQIHAFDGPSATISSDGTHFWPYGLNYDNEGNTENHRRHVLMMAVFRKDMGIE
jgi:hypothetical protein